METERRLALLIDGDNAQAALLPQMLDAVSEHGKITIRRVYGDWSKPNMNSWKDALHTYNLRPEQQFSYTKGKNATDIALTIGAMDILHKEDIDGFCIISSDSDYTPLVNRIRDNNLFVVGVGKNDTAEAFRSACTVFVPIENLEPVEKAEANTETTKSDLSHKPVTETSAPITIASKEFRALFKQAITDCKPSENGWVQLTVVGQSLQKFDPKYKRTYGIKTLSQLAQAPPKFIEPEVRKNKKGNEVTYVRLKVKQQPKK